MPKQNISYSDTGYFSPLMVDYLNNSEELKPFYNRLPELNSFEAQITEKSENFPHENREVLVSALNEQYKLVQTSELTTKHISLLESNTFTVTTGHQLNFFTGPLYFLYKIASAVNLANHLKEAYPAYNFVPVYWMASEDHDFEEINYFNFKRIKRFSGIRESLWCCWRD